MNKSVKIALYAVLAIVAGVSGYFALTNFGAMMARSGQRHSDLEQVEPERKLPEESVEAAASPASNIVATAAGSETNLSTLTNTVSALTNDAAGATNGLPMVAAETTNTVKADGTKVAGEKPASRPALSARSTSGAAPATGRGRIGLWAALFVVSVISLGLLIANDISQYFGNRALKFLYNDEGEGMKNVDYEQAEEVWAKGEHLEAIQLMREYLAKNPREQHVAIRIAEIYEKDLQNPLAAALEYEVVLKHKLPAERWGWAAIHLCNLYFKLNQEQKGFELLRRLAKDYPDTAAAEKARKRLEQVDGGGISEELPAETQVTTVSKASAPSGQQSTGNLPPGFRPKK